MKRVLMVGSALAVIATAALATVTFDPVTGTGFVGKGDVQLALGLNNAGIQAIANSLSFTYQQDTSYDISEEWTTETGGKNSQTITHDITVHKSTSVNDTVSYDARTHKQVDGFNLTGYGSTSETGGPIPNVGDPCPPGGPGGDCTITDVEPSADNLPGGLYVNGVLLGNF